MTVYKKAAQYEKCMIDGYNEFIFLKENSLDAA